ncbi:MAG: hypothetical protein KBS81_02865 [Spirochaetales bacterium]|nr:hypothetical protein [Candidatus Physcosoma equi]
MKKRVLAFLLVLLSALGLWAGKYNDIGLTIGLGTTKVPTKEVSFSYGLDLGLTEKLEVEFWGISDILPQPGAHTTVGADLVLSLMGERNTGSKVSGINLNTLVSVGGFYSFSDKGAGVEVGLVPLLVGSPSISKREKILKTNIGYDCVNRKAFVAFSLLELEVYLKGTFRDFI